MALRVRGMTADEADGIKKLANSRTEPARLVERARIVWLSEQGKLVPDIAGQLGICQPTARLWLKRFNARGLAGLSDDARPGRPATYTVEEVSDVIATSLTDPQALGLPFASWTMDRLEAYLNEEKGITIKRSRIGDILLDEGLRWRTQETWFGDRVDPDFASKRGPSKSCTPNRRSEV